MMYVMFEESCAGWKEWKDVKSNSVQTTWKKKKKKKHWIHFFMWKYKYENKNGSLNNVHFIITVVEASKVVQLLLFIFFYIIYLLIIVWIKLNLQNNCCQ